MKLLHVDVSLETALRGERHRRVPEDVLAQYARLIADAVEVEAAHADEVEVFDNNADDGLVGRQRWGKEYARMQPRLSALCSTRRRRRRARRQRRARPVADPRAAAGATARPSNRNRF